MRNKKIRHLLGNILILASVLILLFTYYPFIKLYFSPAIASSQKTGYFIAIPKINAYAPVIANVNPWQKSDYLKALSQGVAATQDNPWFLFAHSSDLPWRITRYNTAFLRLGELQKGDQIIISKYGTRYQFEVVEKKEVQPEEVQYLNEASPNKLVLMTCTPVGTSLRRLLVFAKLR